MSEAVVPSYRIPREPSSVPWRMLAIAGGILGVVALGAGGWWAVSKVGGLGGVPVVEADPRPFKVRPDDPGGLRVPNQTELILERPGQRAQSSGQQGRPQAVAPGAEAPDLGGLRAAVQAPQPQRPTAAPVQSAPPQAAATALPAAVTPPAAEQPAAPAVPQRLAPPVPNGRVQVQLGALTSEEAARAEWDRLSRRAPELLQGRTPQIARLDRGPEQPPLFRLRTGGIADAEAAQQLCEQVRARGGACVVVRS